MKQTDGSMNTRLQKAARALQDNRAEEALRLLGKVCKRYPKNPSVWFLRSIAAGRTGELKTVIESCKRVLELDPNHAGALTNLANAKAALGKHNEAISSYRKALDADPDNAAILGNYGRALTLSGRRDEATALYEKALDADPENAFVHCSLAEEYQAVGRVNDALRHFRKALGEDPDLAVAHLGLGHLCSGLGGLGEAAAHFQQAIRTNKNLVPAYLGLSLVLRYQGRYEEAVEYCRRAEKLEPRNPLVGANLADLYERQGDHEAAFGMIRQLKSRNALTPMAVVAFTRICARYEACEECLNLLDEFLSRSQTTVPDKSQLNFAAGTLLDKQRRYDEAFGYFRRGNEQSRVPFDRTVQRRKTEQLMAQFGADALARLPRSSSRSARPVFIVGMPRSGTTLVEQILSSHSRVHGAGELSEINAIAEEIKGDAPDDESYAIRIDGIDQQAMDAFAERYLEVIASHDQGATYVTDKMPQNFLHLGLISRLFPEARIIHCCRNPVDTCLSIYFQSFIWVHNYATDLGNLGFYYGEYQRLMEHWGQVIDNPMITVQYEDMIENQEAVTRSLVEFCGLEWEEACLQFHEAKRDVATASYDQVRQPIYRKSMGRWHNYEKHLTPLLEALSDTGIEYD